MSRRDYTIEADDGTTLARVATLEWSENDPWQTAQLYADSRRASVFVLTPEGRAIEVAPADRPIAFRLTPQGAAAARVGGAS